MLRTRTGENLDAWLAKAVASRIPEFQSFVLGVERDKAAVQAGLTRPESNGLVEGKVNKLKLIKRMMYDIVGELEVTAMIQSAYQEASAC